MMKMEIVPLRPEIEDAFYALAAESLPDSDPEQMHRMAQQFPQAFLAMLQDGAVIGAAFGWPRSCFVPDDPSFTLDGIVIHWDHMRHGLGKQLLAAFEQAAASYGAPSVSVGSAGGYVEKFYIDCGYAPKAYKVYQNGHIVVEKAFRDADEYRSYQRMDPYGFVVFEKEL